MVKFNSMLKMGAVALFCSSLFVFPANAQEPEETSDISTETIVEYNIDTGTTTTFELEVDETMTDTSMYIDKVSPLDLEPIDEPCAYPFNGIGYLYIEHEGGQITHGTAFLVGRKLALTAAHCVASEEFGAVTKMYLYIGKNDEYDNGYAQSLATSYFYPYTWDENNDATEVFD